MSITTLEEKIAQSDIAGIAKLIKESGSKDVIQILKAKEKFTALTDTNNNNNQNTKKP